MSHPLLLLRQRGPQNWIWASAFSPQYAQQETQQHTSLSETLAQGSPIVTDWLLQGKQENPDLTLLLATDQVPALLAWFCAAVSARVPVFLGNPRWTQGELLPLLQALAPDVVVGPQQFPDGLPYHRCNPQNFLQSPQLFHSFPQVWGKLQNIRLGQSWKGLQAFLSRQNDSCSVENFGIFIPTGGSSGELRFAQHSWQTLLASVVGLQRSKLSPAGGSIHSVCLLPLHHVSGLMQFVRSLTSGGNLAIAPPPIPKTCPPDFAHLFPQLQPETAFISLVPTQLQRLLQREDNARWLARFHCVLLGGAPAWPQLLAEARRWGIALAPTYGMTETASQVVTLAPQDFARGQGGCGQVLPHAKVEICDPAGRVLGDGQVGQVRVRSQSLCRGYVSLSRETNQAAQLRWQPLPQDAKGPYLPTDDLGFWDAGGYLQIVGRSSDKIISGGENVFPAEIEAVIRATGWVADVVVLGLPDEDWGEQVVALYVPGNWDSPKNWPSPEDGHWLEDGNWEAAAASLREKLRTHLAQQLSPAKRPKQWIALKQLPRNRQGKVNRIMARTLALENLQEP